MNRKKAILLTGTCFGVLLMLLIVASKYNSDQNANSGMVAEESESGGAEATARMQSLQEVRDTIEQVLAEGKTGMYPHLIFADFTPIVTTEDAISTLTITYPKRYHDLDNKALAEKELEVLQAIFPEGLDMDCLYDQCAGGESYESMMARIEDGTYGTLVNEASGELENGIPYLTYNEEAKGSIVHAQIDWGISYVLVRKKAANIDHDLEQEYYAQAADGSLEDAYTVDDGSITIQQVIDAVEQFYNQEFPIPYESEERYRVAYVQVGQRADGTHVFSAGVSRTYHGVVFEYAETRSIHERADMLAADLHPDGSVSFYINTFNNMITEEDSITEIISPAWALQSVSEELAENTEYLVTGMELSYQEIFQKQDDETGANITTAVPVWKIILSNQTDGSDTFFYVNVVTGKITSRVNR